MNSKPKLAALASAAILLGSPAAFAEHDYQTTRDERVTYDYADVVSSRPIVNYVTVSTPVRECWTDTEYYTVNRHGHVAGTLLGAVIGGVVGHQFGSGHGNDAATVAGVLLGAAIGGDAARKRHGNNYGVEHRSRPVQRCKTSYREHREKQIDGYRVTYRYHGQQYMTEMPYDPGRKLRVRIDIRPAG